MLVSLCGVFLWGRYTVWLVPFKTRPMSEILFVVLPLSLCLSLSLSLCLFGRFVGDAFSLFLSLRRWGNPNPFLGFGVPLVSLHLGRAVRLPPVRLAPHLHQGSAQPLCVFFFFVVARLSPPRLGCSWFGVVGLGSLVVGCLLVGFSMQLKMLVM